MEKIEGIASDSLVTFFDQVAQTPWLSNIHEKLLEQTGNWDGKAVLDIGCGTGRLLLRGTGDTKCRIGIDVSEKMIQKAKMLSERSAAPAYCRFMTGEACDLPFVSGQFDLVISAWGSFMLSIPEMGLMEMSRMVKKGSGDLIMLNPSKQMSLEAVKDYCHTLDISGFDQTSLERCAKMFVQSNIYSKEELTKLLKKHGFTYIEHLPVLDGLALITKAKHAPI